MQLPSPWGHDLAGPSRLHLFWEDTHVLHTLNLQTHERRGWKSKLNFLSEMNYCLVPVLALLAYCPLRARNGLEASNRKKNNNKGSLDPFQPFSDAEVCCISSCFVLFLLQLKQGLLWTLKWLSVCWELSWQPQAGRPGIYSKHSAAWERQQLLGVGFFWLPEVLGGISYWQCTKAALPLCTHRVFVLTHLMSNAEKKTTLWPTKFFEA